MENTGNVASDEVVQLYLTRKEIAGAPLRALQGFKRIHLAPAQKTTVTFQLENRQLSLVDETGKRRITPGVVEVWTGGGQPDARSGLPKAMGVRTQFNISSEASLPD